MTVYDIAAELPSIDVLRDRCRALAVLECVVDGGEPYYAYARDWGADEAASMDNGSGDEWTVVFTADGAFIRVFDPDGSGLLEILLDDIAERYVAFAEDHYDDVELDRTAVERIVAQLPLTDPVVRALNPAVTLAGLHEAVTAIGYPVAAS
ncbi:hypothetical protein [Micromonospora sp. NPDC023644]|uniref:hypothetical protein n=1 Tax=Micromonospora sp. NPDC023644 TaxID=3154321 RepID=UPI0033DA305B